VFVGWWLSGIAISMGYFLVLTVILMPIGYMVLNVVPTLQTLRGRRTRTAARVDGDFTYVETTHREQLSFGLRAVYFALFGWWLVGRWIGVAWLASLTIVLLPVSIMMLNRIPEVLTLRRN